MIAVITAVPTMEDDDTPTMILGADGRYEDANAAALAVLGLTIEQLRALPPRALSTTPVEEADSLRAEWERSGATSALGETTLLRPDGTRLRATFRVMPAADGRFRATFEPVSTPVDQPTELYTVGRVLAAWRAAERKLAEVTPDSDEGRALQARIGQLRADHRRLFEAEQQ